MIDNPQCLGKTLIPLFLNQGFASVGWVNYSDILDEYQVHADRYQKWIDSDYHAEMGYLKRGLDRRLNPKLVFPELEGAIVVLERYSAAPLGGTEADSPRYARYMRGIDYHDSMKERLDVGMKALQSTLQQPIKYKVCVDTSAVLERTWAELSGLGWIGKNTLLMNTTDGSYTLIGVVFTDLNIIGVNQRKTDFCGNCTRCITACPTDALSPHFLNPQRCISYLTLEKRGTWTFAEKEAEKIKKGIGPWIAGCDLCQEACPFNIKREKIDVQSEPHSEVNLYYQMRVEELKTETELQYKARIKDSALSRVKYNDFRRNLDQVEKNKTL